MLIGFPIRRTSHTRRLGNVGPKAEKRRYSNEHGVDPNPRDDHKTGLVGCHFEAIRIDDGQVPLKGQRCQGQNRYCTGGG